MSVAQQHQHKPAVMAVRQLSAATVYSQYGLMLLLVVQYSADVKKKGACTADIERQGCQAVVRLTQPD